jgi:adenylate cyclase class 2
LKDQEIEVKFPVADLGQVEAHLRTYGAQLTQERVHEVNLRLDTPDKSLTRNLQVLRLRQDTQARLTYKGPGSIRDEVQVRQEIEFIVSDFEAARSLFAALGFPVSMMYEKYRTMYDLDDVHVTLDEMPYGSFVEIEGPSAASIQAAGARLGFNWERRVLDSYTALFDQVRLALALDFRDLSFANFAGIQSPLAALGIQPADR